ncbi:TPA: hypothetical protein ACN976_000382 [Vibrio campbellii]|uniref:hypothetical protein n=1 Tax=Vibrio sp. YQ_11 TaxID=3367233 RepID=UPI001DF86569|nr:hypothetical protein [Vibrio parahaemolyticus]EIA9324831.1 hypothetical protein [Vibrio parahaemolyticus]EJG1681455.1 hypothetical protein [Vibrio parahaemolyticus]
MKEIYGYFKCKNGAFWTVYNDSSTNYCHKLQISPNGQTVLILGEINGEPESNSSTYTVDEYKVWFSLLDLSAHTVAEVGGASLEELRADLIHQLKIPDELDWSYLLETAARALVQADKTSVNMKYGDTLKIGYDNRPQEFGSHYAPLLPPTT